MDFGKIFKTTLAVVAALAIIAAVVYVGVSVFKAISSAASGSTSTTNSTPFMDASDKRADAKPTSMPASQWKAGIADAIQVHCAVVGMTEDEVKEALGAPAKLSVYSNRKSWLYSTPDKEQCLKYQGETCVEYARDEDVIFFSPAGHLSAMHHGKGCWNDGFFRRHVNDLLD
jgi:hypothetical protein